MTDSGIHSFLQCAIVTELVIEVKWFNFRSNESVCFSGTIKAINGTKSHL